MDPIQIALVVGLILVVVGIILFVRRSSSSSMPTWAPAAAVVVGIVLVAPYVYYQVSPSEMAGMSEDDEGMLGESSRSSSSGPSDEEILLRATIHRDSGEGSSANEHNLRLTELMARADNPVPRGNDSVSIIFMLHNDGDQPVELENTYIAARSPSGEAGDFGYANEGATIEPGGSLRAAALSNLGEETGVWKFWPCYTLAGGSTTCPDGWHEFTERVY